MAWLMCVIFETIMCVCVLWTLS